MVKDIDNIIEGESTSKHEKVLNNGNDSRNTD